MALKGGGTLIRSGRIPVSINSCAGFRSTQVPQVPTATLQAGSMKQRIERRMLLKGETAQLRAMKKGPAQALLAQTTPFSLLTPINRTAYSDISTSANFLRPTFRR